MHSARSRGETAADGGEGGAIRSPPGTVRGVALPRPPLFKRASVGVVIKETKTRTEFLITQNWLRERYIPFTGTGITPGTDAGTPSFSPGWEL
jgi:hypothetical protein